MTLIPLPTKPFAGLELSPVQTTSLTNAAERMAKAGSPLPDSVRQDTAGTVHLTWHLLGCRIVAELTKAGGLRTAVTMESNRQGWESVLTFQVQLQEFFAL